MNSIIPLQNSPERVSLLPIAPGVDFATAVALRRMATSTGATPAYLLAPEVSALLWYMPEQCTDQGIPPSNPHTVVNICVSRPEITYDSQYCSIMADMMENTY